MTATARLRRRPTAARHDPYGRDRTKLRKHKVVMESITQRRKQLRSIICFEAEAPPGYTFIPAGNPRFTAACKELCRKQGIQVFAVTTTPHQKTHGLSQQVHRVGYHFPSTVVARICMEAGFHLMENGNVLSFEKFGIEPADKRSEREASQTTINTEARDVIRDLFPNIPEDDLDQIIQTAFQKGQRKVGTAVELPLARRAQLAVVAHIRHVYTEYDRLLKTTSFQEARRRVEESTLEKLVQWRGEDESGMPELEDVFREVIVISDDDDNDDDDGDESDASSSSDTTDLNAVNREPSVEIVSSNVITHRLEAGGENADIAATTTQQRLSLEAPTEKYRLVQEETIQLLKKSKSDRRGFSRYQAWHRAMGRYRKRTSNGRDEPDSFLTREISKGDINPQRPLGGRVDERQDGRAVPTGYFLDDRLKRSQDVGLPRFDDRFYPRSASTQHQDDRTYSSVHRRDAPDILRFPDGSVFSKIPSTMPQENIVHPVTMPTAPALGSGSRFPANQHLENPRKRIHSSRIIATSRDQKDLSPSNNAILPSIEHPGFSYTRRILADETASNPYMVQRELREDSTRERPFEDLSKGVGVITLNDDDIDYSKRRRLEIQQTSSSRDDAFYQYVEKPLRKIPPPMVRSRFLEPSLGRSKIYRRPVHPLEPSHYMRRKTRPTEHALSRQELLEKSSAAAATESSEGYDRDNSRYMQPRVNTIRQSTDPVLRNDSDLVQLPYTVAALKSHRPSYISEPDDPEWRSKANYYESQRGIIDAEDSLRPQVAHKSSLRSTWPYSSGQQDLHIPHSQTFPDGTSRYTTPTYWVPTPYQESHSSRATSHSPIVGASRKKDTLPVSAIRRYEVHLDKSKDP